MFKTPTTNKYYRLRHVINFETNMELNQKNKKLEEFSNMIDEQIKNWISKHECKVHNITLKDAMDIIFENNKYSLNNAVEKFVEYLETLDGINPNYFINLNYQLNVDLIRRLQDTAKLSRGNQQTEEDNIMFNEMKKRCDDFFKTYSFNENNNRRLHSNLDEPNIHCPVKIIIPKDVLNSIRLLLYNIYLHMFSKRDKNDLFVHLNLVGKDLLIQFSDDIRYYNELPNYVPCNKLFKKFEICSLMINLAHANIKYSTDERIVRNRITRHKNYKRIEELKDYLEDNKKNTKAFTEGYQRIRNSGLSDQEKLQQLQVLISECETKCLDRNLQSESGVLTRIAELETIDTRLSVELLKTY